MGIQTELTRVFQETLRGNSLSDICKLSQFPHTDQKGTFIRGFEGQLDLYLNPRENA